MQVGTRWPVGSLAPDRLPPAMIDAISRVEDELGAEGVDASDWHWTLTWLEMRPIVELDDGTLLQLSADGASVLIREPGDEILADDD